MASLVRRGRMARSLLAGTALVGAAATLGAQVPADTAAPPVDTVSGPLPERRPPLSPRRAFTYSLLVPGYAQSVLGRGRTTALVVAFEAVSLVMIREMSINLREARRNLADSVIVSYVGPDGTPGPRFAPTPFPSALLSARREQLEDWIAVLIANHLFAAADAYVAALLWDLPAEMSVRASAARRGASVALRITW